MSARPLRIGVIGCGGIAQMMHLPHLNERPDLFDVRIIADVKQDVLDWVGQRYGIKERTVDPMKVVTHKDVEAVLLLASGSHEALARATLENKKHLFVEKPFGYDIPETESLIAVAKKSGMQAMVGYHKRFDPAFRRARELVKAMPEGLRFVEVTVLHPDDGAYRAHHPIGPNPENTYRYSAEAEAADVRGTQAAVTDSPVAKHMFEVAGAKATLDQRVAAKIATESLIHDLNVVRGVLGEPERVVTAHTWQNGFAQHSLTKFAGDVHASISWVLVPGVKNYEERVRFTGNHGRVTLVFPSPYLRNLPTPLFIERMDKDDLVVESRTVNYDEAFRNELLAFREQALSGKAGEITLEEPLGDARWIAAIARAFGGSPQAVAR